MNNKCRYSEYGIFGNNTKYPFTVYWCSKIPKIPDIGIFEKPVNTGIPKIPSALIYSYLR